MNSYTIKEYSNGYREEVLHLLKDLWGGSLKSRSQVFKWKYDLNPFFKNKYLYVALDEFNTVAGFRGFFPLQFSHGDHTFFALSPSDMVVSKEHRRKGLFTSLTRYAIEKISFEGQVKLFLNLSSNKKSIPGYLKLGWKELSIQSNMFTRTLSGLLMGKLCNRKIYHLAKPTFDIFDKKMLLSSSKIYVPSGEIEVTKKKYSSEMSKLSYVNTKAVFCRYKDNTYYEWRGHNPNAIYINIYLRDSHGSMLSFCTLIKKGFNQFILADYGFIKTEDLESLLFQLYRRLKISFLKTWSFGINAGVKVSLEKTGFYTPSLVYKLNPRYRPHYCLVRPAKKELSESSWKIHGLDITSISNWNFTPLDSDGL